MGELRSTSKARACHIRRQTLLEQVLKHQSCGMSEKQQTSHTQATGAVATCFAGSATLSVLRRAMCCLDMAQVVGLLCSAHNLPEAHELLLRGSSFFVPRIGSKHDSVLRKLRALVTLCNLRTLELPCEPFG